MDYNPDFRFVYSKEMCSDFLHPNGLYLRKLRSACICSVPGHSVLVLVGLRLIQCNF